jgi:hypothetical protein
MPIAPYKPDQWYVWELMPISHTEMKSIRNNLNLPQKLQIDGNIHFDGNLILCRSLDV